MKNKNSIYFIVFISIFVGFLHFVIGPNYQGVFKPFISGYLMDILLPANMYLLLQIVFRKRISITQSRIAAVIITFMFGTTVEYLQMKGFHIFGSTYDPLDIAMYAIGVCIGLLIDILIINKLEK